VVMILVLPLFLAWSPYRGSLVLRLLVVALGLAVAVGPVYDVFGAADAHRAIGPAVDHAARWIAVSVLVTAVVAALLVVFEARFPPSPSVQRTARVAGRVAVAALLIGLLGLTVARAGSISHDLNKRWHAFKSPDSF